MGGTLSYDFCHVVRNLLLQKDVDLTDHETWRTIFCTDMSDHDIKVYLNWNAVRLMRRNKPNNLAALMYRCMQQLAAFLDRATSPGATVVHRASAEKEKHEQEMKEQGNNISNNNNIKSSTSTDATINKNIVDPCAVRNAIRILIQILPCIYEVEIVVEQTEKPAFLDLEQDEYLRDSSNDPPQAAASDPEGGMTSTKIPNPADGNAPGPHSNTAVKKQKIDDLVDKLLKLPESPFASTFADSFLKYNLTCSVASPGLAFSPILADNATRAKESGWRKESASPSSATSMLPVALGDELVVLLTRLCFIPGFSVEYGSVASSSAMRYLRGYTHENASCGYDVVAELLEADGLFRSNGNENNSNHNNNNNSTTVTKNGNAMIPPTPTTEEQKKTGDEGKNNNNNSNGYGAKLFNTFFSFEVLHNRIQLIRCLTLCLSKNAMVGRSIIEERGEDSLRECFQDSRRSPLALTLLVSCLNFISTYVSRGVVPYSSHYWADVPEKMLSTCTEFCCIALAFPPQSVAPAATENEKNNNNNKNNNSDASTEIAKQFLDAAQSSRQTLWTSLSRMFEAEATAAPFIVTGLCSVLANPVYAATTTLRGSQRVIDSAHEAGLLLLYFCICPGTSQNTVPLLATVALESARDPEKFGGASVLMSLLRVVLRSLSERRYTADAQAALWTLLQLSTQADFVECLGEKIGRGGCPLQSLETLNNSPSATNGDALVLSLCEITCSAAPRWLIPLSELSVNILANVVPFLPTLLEITQFELFHLLEWITNDTTSGFLSMQRASVSQDACVAGMLSLVVKCASSKQNAQNFKPLVASLATEIKISDRIKNQQLLQDGTSSSSTVSYHHGPVFEALAVQTGILEKFYALEEMAIEKMNTLDVATNDNNSTDKQSNDPYSPLAQAGVLPFVAKKSSGGADDDDDVKSAVLVKPSMELLKWTIAHAWAMTIQTNVDAPLVDITKAKMFN